MAVENLANSYVLPNFLGVYRYAVDCTQWAKVLKIGATTGEEAHVW